MAIRMTTKRTRSIIVFLMIVSASVSTHAQQTATITGTVVKTEDSTTIGNATVSLYKRSGSGPLFIRGLGVSGSGPITYKIILP